MTAIKLSWLLKPFLDNGKSTEVKPQPEKQKPKVRTYLDPSLEGKSPEQRQKEAEEETGKRIVALASEYPQDIRFCVSEMKGLELTEKSGELFFKNGEKCSPQRFHLELNRYRSEKSASYSEPSVEHVVQPNTREKTPVIPIHAKTEIASETTKVQLGSPATMVAEEQEVSHGTDRDAAQKTGHSEAQTIRNERNQTSSSSPPGDNGGGRKPPSDSDKKNVSDDGKKGGSGGSWLLIGILALLCAVAFWLIITGSWTTWHAFGLIALFAITLIGIGLQKRANLKINRIEETDEEAMKAAGAIASASMAGRTKRDDRFYWSGSGSREFKVGVSLLGLSVLGVLLFGMVNLFSGMNIPGYVLPLVVLAGSIGLILFYLKGRQKFAILLLLGALALWYGMNPTLGKPKETIIDLTEESTNAFQEVIDSLSKVSATVALSNQEQVALLQKKATLDKTIAVQRIRDSSHAVISELKKDTAAKRSAINKLVNDLAKERIKYSLALKPKAPNPLFIIVLILVALAGLYVLHVQKKSWHTWIGNGLVGLALLGIAILFIWYTTLPNQKTVLVPDTAAQIQWTSDSLKMQQTIDSLTTLKTPVAPIVTDDSELQKKLDNLEERNHILTDSIALLRKKPTTTKSPVLKKNKKTVPGNKQSAIQKIRTNVLDNAFTMQTVCAPLSKRSSSSVLNKAFGTQPIRRDNQIKRQQRTGFY